MLKITKSIEKKLANIASQLPITTYGVPKVRFERLDKERVLKQTYGEFLHKVNHKNRIKKYKKTFRNPLPLKSGFILLKELLILQFLSQKIT